MLPALVKVTFKRPSGNLLNKKHTHTHTGKKPIKYTLLCEKFSLPHCAKNPTEGPTVLSVPLSKILSPSKLVLQLDKMIHENMLGVDTK